MTYSQKLFLFLTRVALGVMYFYAGITKVLDPSWSAAGYIGSAKNFTWFYQWLLQPEILPLTNFINEWGLTLLGVSLVLGIGVRLSSVLGAILMLLYYFPAVEFPFVGHGFIVDEHIVYALILLFFAAIRAGRIWGLEERCSNLPICSRFPKLRSILG